MAKIATLPLNHTFSYISFFENLGTNTSWKMRNRPNFTFHGEGKQVTAKFSFFFSGL